MELIDMTWARQQAAKLALPMRSMPKSNSEGRANYSYQNIESREHDGLSAQPLESGLQPDFHVILMSFWKVETNR